MVSSVKEDSTGVEVTIRRSEEKAMAREPALVVNSFRQLIHRGGTTLSHVVTMRDHQPDRITNERHLRSRNEVNERDSGVNSYLPLIVLPLVIVDHQDRKAMLLVVERMKRVRGRDKDRWLLYRI